MDKVSTATLLLAAIAIMAAQAVFATVHTTAATGGKLSGAVWSPALPEGGGAGVELVFEGGDFSIENDIEGLTVSRLTFSAAGSLSGKAVTLIADGTDGAVVASRGAVTNTVAAPLVLQDRTRFTADNAAASLICAGPFSGAGQAFVDADSSGAQVSFVGDSSGWSGGVDVLRGLLNVTDGKGLGTGPVYVTNKWLSGTSKCVVRLAVAGDASITGPVYLGHEHESLDGRIEVAAERTLVFDGDVFVHQSPICGRSGSSIVFNGKVAKNPLIANASGNVILDNDDAKTENCPLFVFSGTAEVVLGTLYAFWSRVNVETTDFSVSALLPARTGEIVCKADYVFAASNTAFNVQDNQTGVSGIELDGYSQNLGSHRANSVQRAPFCIRNSNLARMPKVRIWQTVDNCSNALYTEGPMHFVKSGPSTLGITNRLFNVGGTLEIEMGMLKILRDGRIGDKVTVGPHGILDLGGMRVSCGAFELDGGIVRNGTLYAESANIRSGAVLAEIKDCAEVSKTGDGDFVTAYPAATSGTVSKEGLVFCYRYDSPETLLQDSGPYGYDLAVYDPEKASNVLCDTQEKRFGGGTLSLTGGNFLCAPDDGWFENIPVGSDPFTLATHFRFAETSGLSSLGLLGLGEKGTAKASDNWMFRNGKNGVTFGQLRNYWWNSDMNLYKADWGSFMDGKWHSVVETWDGTKVRIYLDGHEVQGEFLNYRKDTTAPEFKAGAVHIGTGLNQGATYAFRGWLDETAMWKRAISPEEASAYHQKGVSEEPPLPEVSFLGGRTLIADAEFLDGIANGIVCSYRFDSEDGFLKDSVPGGVDLVVTNATAGKLYSETGKSPVFTAESAHGGGAVLFHGEKMLGTEVFPEKIPLGTNHYTVGFFYKTTYKNQYGLLTYGMNAKSKCNSFLVDARDNQKIFKNYWWNNDAVFDAPDSANGIWHSFVTTWDGERCRYWHDGEEVFSKSGRESTVKPAFETGVFRIGNGQNNNTLNGSIDDVTIWSRAITPDEAAYFGRYGLPESYAELPKNALVSVGDGAVVKPASGKLSLGGEVTLGGIIDGNIDLEDGVTLKGDGTANVTGKVTVKGSGSFVTPSGPAAYPASWTLFTAASYEGTEYLGGWQIDGSKLKSHSSWFGIEGDEMRATARLYGLVIRLR